MELNSSQKLSNEQRLLLKLKQATAKIQEIKAAATEPIAIIGMGCRFPGGSSTPEAFWDVFQNGVDAIAEVPKERWNLDDYYDPDPETPGKMHSPYGGFIDRVKEFDPNFFGISPKETINLDPQHRLLLEVSWEALEHSGKNPQQLKGSQTGVFIGICANDYSHRIFSHGLEGIDAYVSSGNSHSTASGRISYILGLIGPNLVLDTACSSSLVSIHLACSSLRNKECNLALAGGVNLLLSPEVSVALSQGRMLSVDGRCKTFDASANGYVRGDGCGIIVLKRLSDAVADRDNILAVIRGTAINQDGPSSALTVPNGPSQVAVIRQAMANGGVNPADVSYLEVHGTGTSLGDPMEVEALGTVFGKTHSPEQPLIIGSAKTNIGHTEGAAGVAGLMKLVLQLQHQQIAPSLHFKEPNPYINWSQLPVQVSTNLTPWETNGKSRIAGVSSFGFSGTNAHIILEEAPVKVKTQDELERSVHLLTLSAKTETALGELVNSYQNYLKTHPELEVADICHTANIGRAQFNHRLAVVTSNQEELAEKLQKYQQGEEVVGIYSGELLNNTTTTKIAFLFTGQGSQYANMGRQLYQQAPTFREVIHQCEEILSSVETFEEKSLGDILYSETTDNAGSSLLDQTAYTQPVLFAIEYALFKLWESRGIKPDIVMGHSVGEYVAATVAGVFSLEDGLKLIAARGRLMQKLPAGGEMVSVMASESKVLETLKAMSLEEKVAIAGINGPQSIVISGESEAVRSIATDLESAGIKTKQLQVSHAFHSPLMEPMLAEFKTVANQITYNQPRIPIISNLTGTKADNSITTAQYWVSHIREPVKFAQGMKELSEQGYETFLEIGPKPILLGMGRQCLPDEVGMWLPSLRPGVDEWQQMLSSLGQLYVQGFKVDWLGFDQNYARQKVALPTYPFQRERYWIETTENKQKQHQNSENINQTPIFKLLTQGNTETLTQQLATVAKLSPEQLKLLPELLDILAKQHQEQLTAATIKNWFYEIQWKPLTQTNSNTNIQPTHWLILADTTGVAEKLAQKLQQQGYQYSLVYRGENYQKLAAGKYQLNPSIPEEFEKLYQEVQESTEIPLSRLIHFWSLDAPESKDLTLSTLEETQLWGCGSVMYLLQTVLKNTSTSQLWLITRGSQSVLSQENNIAGIAASPLWGLGRVVSLEHPQLWGGLVDLDPQAPETDEVEMLWQLLVNEQEEDNLALRGENTYVARLANQEPPDLPQPLSLSSDGSYLITGGLGALGLHTAEWLVSKGAKNIVLTGRRLPSEKATESIKELEKTGCQVTVLLGDVSVETDIAKILEQIQTSMPKLKGIIHTAGVLDDGIIEQMNWERFAKVMSPKVIGTWHLHTLTQNLPLDFFICFSSIASIFGSLGQGNYAAANAFMDALANYRRSQGLSALAINWGAWASGGMAARLAVEHQNRIQSSGIGEIAPKQGMYALELLLTNKFATAQVGVVDIQWQVLEENWSGYKINSLLRELLQKKKEWEEQDTGKQKVKAEFLATLEEVSNEKRQEILTEHVREQVAHVLGFSSSKLPEVNVEFMEMGMDSLTSVELRNKLQNSLKCSVPSTLVFDYPTINQLVDYLAQKLNLTDAEKDQINNLSAQEIDFNAEAILDPTIIPKTTVTQNIVEPQNILLTGATGFVGTYLLDELLQKTSANIYCLIRANDTDLAKQKLKDKLESYLLWNEEKFSSRVIPVVGDLSSKFFGLPTEEFSFLANQIDVIYHSGAWTNHLYPYTILKPTNVLGTQEVLRLASQTYVKPVHFISTLEILLSLSSNLESTTILESDPLGEAHNLKRGYGQSKWVAEKLVAAGMDLGIPTCIYRLGMITPDANTGASRIDDRVSRYVIGCIQLGMVPILEGKSEENWTPINETIQAIVYLSQQETSLGKTFNLVNSKSTSWNNVFDLICSLVSSVKKVSLDDWQIALSNNPENPVYPYFFGVQSGMEKLTGKESDILSGVTIDDRNTQNGLLDSEITFSSIDKPYLEKMLSYLKQSGFLSLPS
ncbi:type I polyketide synthase [Okeania hirsuta]|uniref:MgiR n=2 Tax=Okeania hirsuta TaxID=1458930 RepID=A0A3Q8LXU5_9CYAN|nr:type I polyketide synthase [Okeania hirsuta]AZH23819.1 MgiR [Okeania hirsuta]TDH64710.1 MgiR [Okeania hirsuta]